MAQFPQTSSAVSDASGAHYAEPSRERKTVRVTAKRLCSVLFVALFLFTLAACSNTVENTTPTNPSSTTPQTKPTTLPAGTVLYQADWSHGQSDWQLTHGWKLMKSMLQTDASEDLTITIPYRPTVADYAIEVHSQIVHVPVSGGNFQITADKAPDKDGYQAGIISLRTAGKHPFAIHPSAQVHLSPLEDVSGTYQVIDFEPGNDWHTYRVEVKGNYARLLIDDYAVSFAASSQTHNLSTGPLQIKCSQAVVRIDSVRILTL